MNTPEKDYLELSQQRSSGMDNYGLVKIKNRVPNQAKAFVNKLKAKMTNDGNKRDNPKVRTGIEQKLIDQFLRENIHDSRFKEPK